MEKDAEILSVGKIAESARFAEEEDLSLKTDFVSSSEASYGWLPSVAFVESHRGQVPLLYIQRSPTHCARLTSLLLQAN